MINAKYSLLVIVCMSMQQVFCMEQSDQKKEIITTALSKMSEIKTRKDVKPFKGFIVAYTTTSEDLGKGKGYSLYQGNSTKYGYIDKNHCVLGIKDYVPFVGWILCPLLKEEESGYYALVNHSIDKANVLMRAATMQEINQVRIAISDTARFGNLIFGTYNQNESTQILQECNQLKKHYAEHLAKALLRCYEVHEQNPELKLPPVKYAILPAEILLRITKFKYGVEN